MIDYTKRTNENHAEVLAHLQEQFGGTLMICHGEPKDAAYLPGICAYNADRLVGLLTYEIRGKECEFVTLSVTLENQGIGSALLERGCDIAKASGCLRIMLITTNDNIRALSLYQKRGFDMVCLYRNSMDRVREFKPYVPLIGNDGIPLRHEIELERKL